MQHFLVSNVPLQHLHKSLFVHIVVALLEVKPQAIQCLALLAELFNGSLNLAIHIEWRNLAVDASPTDASVRIVRKDVSQLITANNLY
jgi:hypothetical protein